MYYLAVPCLILLGVILASGRKEAFISELDKNEHPLKVLYPLASIIYGLICRGKERYIFGDEECLREIYINEDPKLSGKKQGCKCIASIIAVIGTASFICFAYAYTADSVLLDGRYLKRNDAGLGEAVFDLLYTDPITEGSDIKISVSERKLHGEELVRFKEKVKQYIDKKVLKDNTSADCVRGKLDLMTEIPGTAVKIKWSEENSWFIGVDGTLKNEELTEPVRVSLRAALSYFDETWDYENEITIYPPIITESDIFIEKLKSVLKKTDEETQTEELYELPTDIDGNGIEWKEQEDNTTMLFFLLGVVAAGVIVPAMKQDMKKKKKERTEQMMRDYPDIISKFVMLITAGMTCRAAWGKICSDYARTREKSPEGTSGKGSLGNEGKGKIRYAYEEMLISDKEMHLGMPEIKVYERFGTRCSVPAYNRFGTLLARNIKRGSAGIIEILESEAEESFAERKENVRKEGEEAGTKLLLPMFGMLILVIAIVVVPAFSSFSF